MRNYMKWDLIKTFSGKNRHCFTSQDVIREYPDHKSIYLSRLLSDMVKQGMLYKVSRVVFHIVPLRAKSGFYVPDSHQLASYLMHNKEYYIGFYSAMQIHGLVLQPPVSREIIVTTKQIKPALRTIKGIDFQFVLHSEKRFFGYINTWINQFEKAKVSDLEKTIVDAVGKPQLCGGIMEVGNAIYQSHFKGRTDTQKLFYYLARFGSQVAKKRYLFLSELLGLEWTADHERMLENCRSGFSLLDPAALDQGIKRSRFGLKINVDIQRIKAAFDS